MISDLIKSVVLEKTIENQGKDRGSIQYEVPNGAGDIFVSVNQSDFKRVLSNLINNSYEAIPSTGHISLELEKTGNHAIVRVRDNGKGISKNVLEKLMGEGGSYGKAGEAGFGLGLSYAKQMAIKWGGKIDIQSEEGNGTCVSLNLPLSDSI